MDQRPEEATGVVDVEVRPQIRSPKTGIPDRGDAGFRRRTMTSWP